MPCSVMPNVSSSIEVFSATSDQLQAWCRDGRVTDSKTLIGMLWLQNVLAGAWTLDWRP